MTVFYLVVSVLVAMLGLRAQPIRYQSAVDASFLLLTLIVHWNLCRESRSKNWRYLRGRRLSVAPCFRFLRFNREDTVQWGSEPIPASAATTHFLVVGTTGSGKTLLINRLMGSVLPTIGYHKPGKPSCTRRALVYDAKTDVMPTLHHLASCRIITLHPFDARGAAWDIASDVTSAADALQAASILLPLERTGNGNPFFTLASQNIIRGVMVSFIHSAPGTWTLRDLILAVRYEERLRSVLERTADGRAIIDQYFRSGETLQSIRATIATKIAPFEVVASAWEQATEKVSAREFVNGEFVLVLGNDEAARTAIDAVNRLLFQRISELTLAKSETRSDQTWFFLDEVREAGKLEGLSRLMTKGRSKGACVALGFQSIEGLREVYGTNVADEIVGLANNKAILRLDSPVTAQWASDLFGKAEVMERRLTTGRTRSRRGFSFGAGRNYSVCEQRSLIESVLPSEFMMLSPTGPRRGLSGYFLGSACRPGLHSLGWHELQANRPALKNEQPSLVHRDAASQSLREWTTTDHGRLDLPRLHVISSKSGSNYKELTDNNHQPKPVRERLRRR